MGKSTKNKRQLRKAEKAEPVSRDIENAIAYAEANEPDEAKNQTDRPPTLPSEKRTHRKEIKSTASAKRQREKAKKGAAMQEKLEARASRTEEKRTKRTNAKQLW